MEATYAATIGTARVVFRALGLRLEVEGDERVPSTGPVVLASNHVSFLDFLLVGLAARSSRRNVRFLARHEVWGNPLVARAMDAMGHVPVDRTAPAAAYLHARALLRGGEAVGVFPEGGVSTSFTVRALLPGAVALAQETGAPLLPLAIWGPQRIATALHRPDLRRNRPVSIRVGTPYTVPTAADRTEEVRRLGSTLQGLVDGLQRRPVHRPRAGEQPWWHPAHLGGGAPTPDRARELERSVHPRAVEPIWLPRGVGEGG
ncbi:MAG: lysophospholipid acyltransferase family protein [Nocardioides sp.]